MQHDLHLHSKYSYDSIMDPEKMIKVAKKKGLDGIAVTDHNTITGGLQAHKINSDPDFQVIIGSEIKTEHGDLIGLFLNEEINSTVFIDAIDEIKNQGGLAVLPHPYRNHSEYPNELIRGLDAIEGFNSRSREKDNKKSWELANQHGKTMVAGSDAHFYFEIGRGSVETQEDLISSIKKKNTVIHGMESNYYFVHGLSVALEQIKKIK